ncbi:MAG: hypothetical protein WKG32_06930 [Gemmatimonadaceae bacterium]
MAMIGQPVLVRTPLPIARSIRWKPIADRYYLLGNLLGHRADDFVLFVAQPVLIDVQRQLRDSRDGTVRGLLCGYVGQCRTTDIHYSVVTSAVAATAPERGAAAEVEREEQVLERLCVEAAEAGETVLGWYRSRPKVGTQLAAGDAFICKEYFSSPWQTVLVVTPDGNGGFFQYKRQAARNYCIPFHELGAPDNTQNRGPRGTTIGWRAYESSDVVKLLPERERDALVAAARSFGNGGPPSLKARMMANLQRRVRWMKGE